MLISNGMFNSWIDEFTDSENDRILWDVWLHKVNTEMSYAEFKKKMLEPTEDISDEKVADIVTNSFDILNGFNPAEG